MVVRGDGARLLTWSLLSTPLLLSAAPSAPAAEQQGQVIEEVVVVGSRIQRPDYAFSNPVLSVDGEAIEVSGTTNLTSFLKELPALAGSLDANDAAGSNTFIGGTGLELLDLRNLGVDRTLVLINGRRHVAGLPGSAAVDVDTIPVNLIDRVEVLTGGASAIYGADGVTGVVNFVLKDDFEGFNVRAQTGRSADDDSDSHMVSLLGGRNFSDGRGNVTLSLEFTREERLHASERDFAAGGDRRIFVTNPDDFDDDPNVPDEIPLGDIRFFDSSRDGAVDTDFDFANDFNGDDSPFDGGSIPFIPPFYQQGGDGTPLDDYIGDLLPEQDRYTANMFFDYELNTRATVFGEIKYSRNDSLTRSQPSFDFFLFLEPDYAYLDSTPNIAAAAAGGPVLVSRDHFDLGVRGEDIQRDTFRWVLGVNGEVTEGIDYEASYIYGNTSVENEVLNNRFNDRFAAALDAVTDPDTGEVVCRSTLDPTAEPFNLSWQGWNEFSPIAGTWARTFRPGPGSGCVPVNIFGDGSVSAAARDWIMQPTVAESELTQRVAQAYLTGSSDRWFSLPAGGVGFAMGVEYREEESSSRPAAEDRAGVTFGNVIEPSSGDYDVKEFFAEVDVPLLNDAPGAENLAVDAAVRFSDYSTIGNATTWKLGFIWQPIQDLTFRGTRAEATRAPNIGELFDPGAQTFELITDPCDVTEIENGTEFRAENCAQILSSLGLDPDTYTDPNSSSVAGILTGNEDLSEEVAETDTLGIILQPRFIDNLTISVDWYDIELTDAIRTATPEEAAELCVDLPSTDNAFCGLIDRDETTGGISDFTQRPVNVANFVTEGYDFTLNYLLNPADWGVDTNLGVFNFRLVGNKLEELSFVNLPGADPDPDLGEEDAPEWQTNFDLTWTRGPLLVNYGYSWFDETQRYTLQEREGNPDIAADRYLNYKERSVHDIHVAYEVRNQFEVYGGISNFTDEKPDVGRTFYPVSAVGRFFYLGLDVNLPAF